MLSTTECAAPSARSKGNTGVKADLLAFCFSIVHSKWLTGNLAAVPLLSDQRAAKCSLGENTAFSSEHLLISSEETVITALSLNHDDLASNPSRPALPQCSPAGISKTISSGPDAVKLKSVITGKSPSICTNQDSPPTTIRS